MSTLAPQFDDALYATLRRVATRAARGHNLDRDDLVQAVAVRIVRRRLLERWCPSRGSFEAYLYVIARSEALSLRRRARRRCALGAQFREDTLAAQRRQVQDLTRGLASAAPGSLVRDAARRLSPEAQRVLDGLLNGLSREEVRQVVGYRADRRGYRELKEALRAAVASV